MTGSSVSVHVPHTIGISAYVTLAASPSPYGGDWGSTSRGGDLSVIVGGGTSRRVASVEGDGTVYPVVADESLSTILLAVAHGDKNGRADCIEMFEVRTDDGTSTRLVSRRIDKNSFVDGPGRRYLDTAGLARGFHATYSASGRLITYSPGLAADTIGFLVDGVDRSFRIQSKWTGPFPSPAQGDITLDGDTAARSLACYGNVQGPAVWSPYGDRIAVPCDDGLGVVDPVGATGRSVRVRQSVVGWDRFGDLLVASDDGATLEVQSVDVYGGTFDLTTLDVEYHEPNSGSQWTPLEFSPDGDSLLMEVERPDGRGVLTAIGTGEAIRVTRPGIGQELQLASTDENTGDGFLVDSTWTPDSRSVAYVTPVTGSASRSLMLVDVASGAATKLATVPVVYGNGVWRYISLQ
jgi:hypothetical protein